MNGFPPLGNLNNRRPSEGWEGLAISGHPVPPTSL